MKEKRKYLPARGETRPVILTKHVPFFISFIRINVFHPRAAPLITRCVLLQGRGEIFLSRGDPLDDPDEDEGNGRSLFGHEHHGRRDHGAGILQRFSTSGYQGRGHYRRSEHPEDH